MTLLPWPESRSMCMTSRLVRSGECTSASAPSARLVRAWSWRVAASVLSWYQRAQTHSLHPIFLGILCRLLSARLRTLRDLCASILRPSLGNRSRTASPCFWPYDGHSSCHTRRVAVRHRPACKIVPPHSLWPKEQSLCARGVAGAARLLIRVSQPVFAGAAPRSQRRPS